MLLSVLCPTGPSGRALYDTLDFTCLMCSIAAAAASYVVHLKGRCQRLSRRCTVWPFTPLKAQSTEGLPSQIALQLPTMTLQYTHTLIQTAKTAQMG